MSGVHSFLTSKHPRVSWLQVDDLNIYLRKSLRAHPEDHRPLSTIDLANWTVLNENLEDLESQHRAAYFCRFLRLLGRLEEMSAAQDFEMVFIENLLDDRHFPFLARCGYKVYPNDNLLLDAYKLLNPHLKAAR